MLKRKNEEDTVNEQENSATKRVALDADAIDENGDLEIDEETLNPDLTSINNTLKTEDESVADADESDESAKKISSHKVQTNDSPTYTHFRMLCQVKEAALVVGKGGEKINHIKEASQTKINVSDNIRGITERVIHVRGSSENVAKAFGLITRAILDEEEDIPSSADSKVLELTLLVPHQLIGYVIGKQGSKFREIEESSAAKLSASPQSLPFSTDRCLLIRGVSDAIHIATYYVAQTILEHKPQVHGTFIFYNPGNALNKPPNNQHGLPPNPLLFHNLLNFNNGIPQLAQNQFVNYGEFDRYSNSNNNGNNNNTRNNRRFQQRQNFHSHPKLQNNINQVNSHYLAGLPIGAPISLPLGASHVSQEIFIPNEYVGNVIGKSGKNIKQINETSGSKIIIGDPDPNSTERKITLTGSSAGNQTAIFLINNRIEVDKKNNAAKAQQQSQQNFTLQQQQQSQNVSQSPNGNDQEKRDIQSSES